MQLSDISLNNHQVLFDAIEYNYPSSREDRNTIKKIILDEKNPLYLRAMVLSALTLNLLKYFDNEKFESLYTYTLDDQDIVIRIRAYVAIILVTMKHDVRISLDEKLVEQLNLMFEDFDAPTDKNILLDIQIGLIKCTQAHQAAKKMKESLGSQIEQGLNIIKDNKGKKDDIAPAWDEYLEESGLQEQINDLIDLQRDGIDIMLDSFAQMSHLPFFKIKCNWFIPFSEEYPLINSIAQKSKRKELLIKVMTKSGNMCSTDKYSNVLMLALMPDSQMEQIETALKANDVKIDNIVEAKPEDEIINYLHDLYRYYYISKLETDEYNPFNRSLYFGNYFGLNTIIKKHETKTLVANCLYRFKFYKEAIIALKDIIKIEENEEYLQKYAFSLIHTDAEANAKIISETLSRTNYLFPGNKWTIKNLYKSLDMLCVPKIEVEKVLRDGYKAFPEDIYFINHLASCLMIQGKYEEALQLLFKSDIIKENYTQTMRLLVECAKKMDKKAIVEKYTQKLRSIE